MKTFGCRNLKVTKNLNLDNQCPGSYSSQAPSTHKTQALPLTHHPTYALNKIQFKQNIKLLHVSTPVSHPRGVFWTKEYKPNMLITLTGNYNIKILQCIRLMSIKLHNCDVIIVIVSHSRYKFVVVYILYTIRIQTSVSASCDPKRSCPVQLALLILDNWACINILHFGPCIFLR
jgi:hypothetical protein